MTNKQKVRLASISLLAGCTVSSLLSLGPESRSGFHLSGPGYGFSSSQFFAGRDWLTKYALAMMAMGNVVCYAWLSYLAIRADLQAKGRLGKYLL
jgi:hypothetical protein